MSYILPIWKMQSKKFQNDHNQVVDGIVGKKQLKQLISV